MAYTNTVVIADDADFVRTMLGFVLEKAGYNTLTGSDGSEALTLFDGRDIDLLITDLNMPNMDGMELITAVRADKQYRYTPIILFIANDAGERDRFSALPEVTTIFDKNDIRDKLLPAVKKLIGDGTL